MVDFVDAWLKPELVVMLLAAIFTFVTVLTFALPLLARDRTSQRMKVMATERDKMRSERMAAKVKALSAEAKASSAVLGSLPFIVTVMVYITTPEYIGILFKTKVGQFLLLCAGAWMTCGLLIMRKMINFKY